MSHTHHLKTHRSSHRALLLRHDTEGALGLGWRISVTMETVEALLSCVTMTLEFLRRKLAD